MANFKRCDKCGKESPDERGLYISNRWISVKVCFQGNIKKKPKNRHLEYCQDCYKEIEIALGVS